MRETYSSGVQAAHLPAEIDVAVIGGGPAGLAAAIAARRKGLSVAVLDSARPPIDKVCGEGLMPDALTALRKLGVDLPCGVAHPFHGIRFVDGSRSAAANFPSGYGLGIRRTTLHALLCEHAAAAGAQLAWGTLVTGIAPRRVQVGKGTVRCRWIIGADGMHSRVRRWAGLDSFSRNSRRFAFRMHFPVSPWSEHMEIYWGPNWQIYVTPVASDEVCTVVMSANPRLRVFEALAQTPGIRERLAGLTPSSRERGSLAGTCRLDAVCRAHMALLGDASGTVDPIAGEGLCLAFSQAIALAEAMAAGDLTGYAAEHRKCARRPSFMADFMLTLGMRPRLRGRIIGALALRPKAFTTMLAMHVGASSALAFAGAAGTLGWQMLTV